MLCAATLAATLVPSTGIAAPGDAARPRVVVVNAVDLPDSLADIRAQLRTTLNDAVAKHGFDLAPQASSCDSAFFFSGRSSRIVRTCPSSLTLTSLPIVPSALVL